MSDEKVNIINNNAFSGTDDFVGNVIDQEIQKLQEQQEDGHPKFNELAIYFGENHTITAPGVNGDKEITIYQPTIEDYIKLGEYAMYSIINPFTQNTTSCRVRLWDSGIDWNKISDWELFIMVYKSMELENSKVFFGEEIDFTKFEPYVKTLQDQEQEIVLYNEKIDMEINQKCYEEIREYFRYMFNIFPEEEFAYGKKFKQEIINNDKLKMLHNKQSNSSTMLSLISFCLNHPGFKYKKNELRDVGIVEFMDSVQRLQIYESTKAITMGQFCGMADLSKVDRNLFNFMRSISNAD